MYGWLFRMSSSLKQPFNVKLPWWCAIELGRRFILMLVLALFPGNTVSPDNTSIIYILLLLFIRLLS